MNNSLFIIINIGLFLLSTVLVRVFCAVANRGGLIDLPNARSAHNESIPRGAGLVFVLLWFLGLGISYRHQWVSLQQLWLCLPSIGAISLLGFWDDCRSLRARFRLYVQIVISGVTLYGIGDLSSWHLQETSVYLGIAGYVLGLLVLVWSTNAFNFMDGLDGLAACEAIFVLGIGGFLFWWQGQAEIARLAWMMVAGVAGFLVWNWPKAKVFMGDVGSYCLGFTIALFALIGESWYQIPISLWVILYGLFWFDATVTLIRRFILKENLATAHRNHAFQRLHRAGFSSTQILTGAISVNIILAAITVTLYFNPMWIRPGTVLTVLLLALLYLRIEKIHPMVKSR